MLKPTFPIILDEEELARTLEGGPDPRNYYEIVAYTSQKPVLTELPLSLFPARRVVFQTPTFSTIRLYTGQDHPTVSQQEKISDLYYDQGSIIVYKLHEQGVA